MADNNDDKHSYRAGGAGPTDEMRREAGARKCPERLRKDANAARKDRANDDERVGREPEAIQG